MKQLLWDLTTWPPLEVVKRLYYALATWTPLVNTVWGVFPRYAWKHGAGGEGWLAWAIDFKTAWTVAGHICAAQRIPA